MKKKFQQLAFGGCLLVVLLCIVVPQQSLGQSFDVPDLEHANKYQSYLLNTKRHKGECSKFVSSSGYETVQSEAESACRHECDHFAALICVSSKNSCTCDCYCYTEPYW